MQVLKFLDDIYGITEPWRVVNDWEKDYVPDDSVEFTEADMLPLDEVELRFAAVWHEAIQTSKLNAQEKEVLFSYYGIGQQKKSLAKIGERYGVTGARIGAVKKKALRKLRHPYYTRKYMLKSCLILFLPAKQIEQLQDRFEEQVRPLREELHELESRVRELEAKVEYCDSAIETLAPATIRIEEMWLSLRAYNVLRSAGYRTVEDFQGKTVQELRGIRNLGRRSLEELLDKLEGFGIKLEEGGDAR